MELEPRAKQKRKKKIMKAIPTLIVSLTLLAFPVRAADFLTFYVAPKGDDRGSGLRADAPLATLSAALKAVRQARKAAGRQTGGDTILLRGGDYELAEPVVLNASDSGRGVKEPFTIAAYPGERPVLSGGRRITGWKPVPGHPGLWRTEVPGVREGEWYFRQLFVDGERKQRARTPNAGFFRIQGASPQDRPVRLKYRPGDVKEAWARDGDVEVIALLAWAHLRMQIRQVDAEHHVAILSGNPRPSNREANARYYIENAPDGLDQPGEWYLQRRTGVLTYWAKAGEDLSTARVIAPRLDALLILRGDFEHRKPIHHVVLRGLTFRYTRWDLGPHGEADTQAAIAVHGDVRAEAAVDCVIQNCVFRQLAGYAVECGRGCQRDRILGNEMVDLGAGGVRLGETAKPGDPFEWNHGHQVMDNHIHHLGRVYPPAVGILILQSGRNRVAHNHIHDLYYTAISIGWNWGYQETPCYGNLIAYNHLHDIGQSMLSDMGAIYTLGIQKDTVIRNNLIHDVNSFTYGGWGLYPDEGSSEILWEDNVVYRTKSAGFHQHYGRENIVRNNIFAFGREHQLMRTRQESHLSFIFTHNIVYFDSGTLLGSHWSNDRFQMDYNLYYDTRAGGHPEIMRFAGAKLEDWRRRGHDRHSLIADPLFVAPEANDFRLKPDSPAWALGFHAIDLSEVGPRKAGKFHLENRP